MGFVFAYDELLRAMRIAKKVSAVYTTCPNYITSLQKPVGFWDRDSPTQYLLDRSLDVENSSAFYKEIISQVYVKL